MTWYFCHVTQEEFTFAYKIYFSSISTVLNMFGSIIFDHVFMCGNKLMGCPPTLRYLDFIQEHNAHLISKALSIKDFVSNEIYRYTYFVMNHLIYLISTLGFVSTFHKYKTFDFGL